MEQDQNTQGVTPPQENSPFPKSETGEGKFPIVLVGVCAAILVLVLLGWYMMRQTQMQEEVVPIVETPAAGGTVTDEAAASQAAIVAFDTQSTSDEVPAIEADLATTDFSSLNDMSQI